MTLETIDFTPSASVKLAKLIKKTTAQIMERPTYLK